MKRFVEHTGVGSSYLESSILEQTLHTWQGTGLSTMQVLLDANRQGIPIYQIDASNVESIMPRLALVDEAVLTEIREAIGLGLVVTVPERVPSKELGVTGIGYIVQDPVTGAGAYRIAGGLNGAEGHGVCAEPELEPVAEGLRDIVLAITVLAALIWLIAASGGTMAPQLARIFVGAGFVGLTRVATAGPGFCNPIPVSRKGGDPVHDQCANTRLENIFPGQDVCVAAPGLGEKRFDAFDGAILWEVKTYNFANQSFPGAFERFFLRDEITEAKRERTIAQACGYHFWYTVGDARHPVALDNLEPGFVQNVPANFEIDPVNCLQPKK